MKTFTNFRTWSGRAKNAAAAVLFLAAYTISMVAPFVPIAYAASIPSNKVGFSSVGFILGGSYSMVSGQPTGVGELKNGNVGGYPEGACIPAEFKVTNNSALAGDTVISPIYDYYGSGVVGITNYERVTTGLSGDPSASADNLNDFTFTGQPLSSATSFPSTAGSISANVTGPFAGDNAGTTATTSTDAFRHYNISLTNIPAGATVYIMLCGRLGLDASEYPGSSLSLRTVQGGAENVPIPVNQIRVLPNITITKTIASGTALASDFSFNIYPDPNNGLSTTYTIPIGGNSVTIPNVNPDGGYRILESGPSGYLFSGGSGSQCRADDTTIGTSAGTMYATVAAGKPATNATCNFTNAVQTGSITITKDAIPNSAQDFSFTTTGSGLTNFSLDDDANATLQNTRTFSNLLPGTYTIAEDAVTGWDFDNLSCTGTGVVKNGASVTITLAPGASVSCTYTNRQQGKIIVSKVTNPSGDLTSFPVSISPTADVIGATTGSVTTASPVTFTVKQGTYSVAEDLSGLPNWSNTGNTCTNLTINGNTPIVNGVPTLSCTVTNAKLAKLTIVKDAVPNDAQDFSFTTSGTGLSNFSLDDDADATLSNTKVFSNLALGQTYTVSEDTLTGWKLTNLACSGGAIASPTTVGAISFVPTAGQEATCTYTNTKLGSIAGLKWDDLNGDGVKDVTESTLDNWKINLTGTDMNGQAVDTTSYITGTASPGSGAYSFDNLLPGTYTVTETQQTNWVQTSTNPASINLSAGQNVTGVDFGNRGQGTITVVKHLSPTSDEGKFNLFVDGNEEASNVGHNGTTSAVTVWAGSHSVSETGVTLSNYSTTYSCSNGQSGTGTSITGITVNAGDAITCTITNTRKQGTVKVVKDVTNDNGGTKTAAKDFTFTNNDGSAQTFIETTDPDGQRVLTLPVGSTFDIEEVKEDQDGYTTSYTGTCSGTVTEQEQTCTITNNDNKPILKLTKIVNNQFGGEAVETDWTLKATNSDEKADPEYISGEGGVTSDNKFDAGTYTLTEAPTDGDSDITDNYTASKWKCNGEVLESNVIAIALGDSVSCEITNSDTPAAIVGNKTIVNADASLAADQSAAEDWEIWLYSGVQNDKTIDWAYLKKTTTAADGSYSFDNLVAGWYKVVETLKDGWTQIFGSENVFSIGMGETYGDSEGEDKSDFGNFKNGSISGFKWNDLDASGTWDKSAEFGMGGWTVFLDKNANKTFDNGEVTTVTATDGSYSFDNLVPGAYSVCEVQRSGWVQTHPGPDTCQVVIIDQPGETNPDINFGNQGRATIKIVKALIPSADTGRFNLQIGNQTYATNVGDGENTGFVPVAAGTYDVIEQAGTGTNMAHYEPQWSCEIGQQGTSGFGTSTQLTVAAGESAVCTFTNIRKTGKLTVVKTIVDEYSGKATEGDFTYKLTNEVLTKETSFTEAGTVYILPVGTGFKVVETKIMSGYEMSNMTGCEGTIAEGDQRCTITNTAIQPELTVKKIVNNRETTLDGDANDFTMRVSAIDPTDDGFPGSTAGTKIGLDAGEYLVAEDSEKFKITTDPANKTADYLATYSEGCAGTVALGDEKTCTVTNTAILKPAIKIEKIANQDTVYSGDTVTYTFKVTNAGNTPLSDISVSDTNIPTEDIKYVIGDDGDNTLELGEVWIYNADYVVPADVTVVGNTVTATGTDDDETEVENSDDHELKVIHPAFTIVKTGPAQARPGETVTYTFTITNTGDTDLVISHVLDSIAGEGKYVSGDVNEDFNFNSGEVWVANATYAIPSNAVAGSDIRNTVEVCAEDTLENTTCQSDDHVTKIFVPQVLGETVDTPAPTLATTGLNIIWVSLVAIITALASLYVAFSRRRYVTCN